MSLGEFIGSGAATTRLLLHLNGNSNDSSGNGFNGTATAITYGKQYGKFNEGALFNGSTSKIKGLSNLGIDGGDITISLWSKFINTPGSNGVILFAQQGSTSKIAYQIYIGQSNLTFLRSRRGIDNPGFSINFTTTLSSWYNFILTYNYTSQILRGYVNGELIGSATNITGNGTVTVGNGWAIQDFIETYYGDKVLSDMDDFIVENRTWTPQEIQKYYTNALGRFVII